NRSQICGGSRRRWDFADATAYLASIRYDAGGGHQPLQKDCSRDSYWHHHSSVALWDKSILSCGNTVGTCEDSQRESRKDGNAPRSRIRKRHSRTAGKSSPSHHPDLSRRISSDLYASRCRWRTDWLCRLHSRTHHRYVESGEG